MKKKYNEKTAIDIIDKVGARPEMLVQILHAFIKKFSYIDEQAIRLIAKKINLSRAEIHGVVSFYHDFRTEPTGEKVIKICQAEACQSMGSRELTKYAEKILDVNMHQTSKDMKLTLEPVYCLGNCALSPAIMIDEKVYGKVDEEKLNDLVENL
jgi:formate dehydrogenase subunit gamma